MTRKIDCAVLSIQNVSEKGDQEGLDLMKI